MEIVLLLLIASGVVWEIQRLMVRKRLNLLSETLDMIASDCDLPNLDFFRSPKVRKYLSNSAYAGILNTKAERIREGLTRSSREEDGTKGTPEA